MRSDLPISSSGWSEEDELVFGLDFLEEDLVVVELVPAGGLGVSPDEVKSRGTAEGRRSARAEPLLLRRQIKPRNTSSSPSSSTISSGVSLHELLVLLILFLQDAVAFSLYGWTIARTSSSREDDEEEGGGGDGEVCIAG